MCVTFIQVPITLRYEDTYAYDMFVYDLYFVTLLCYMGWMITH